jgi:hypothetical protein
MHVEGEQGDNDSDKIESDTPAVEENPEVEDDHATDEEMQEEETLEETTTGSSKKKASMHTQTQIELSVPHIPDSVVIVEDMLGCVPKLWYVDHDVTEVAKFPELAQEVYMENRGSTSKGIPIMEPKQWIVRLYNSGHNEFIGNSSFGRGEMSMHASNNFWCTYMEDFYGWTDLSR